MNSLTADFSQTDRAGKVLTGLAKRIAPEVSAQAIGTPADIDALVAQLTAQA